MKIICEKEKLLKGINSVINGVASKTTMPVLEGILIQTNDKEVKLALNNYLIINNDEQKYNYSSNGYQYNDTKNKTLHL